MWLLGDIGLVLASLPVAVAAGGADPLAGAPSSATQVVTGFAFTEGPLWDDARGGLLFSEFTLPSKGPGGSIHLLSEPSSISLVRRPSDNANGLTLDTNGDLLAAEHHSRSVTRMLAGGAIVTLASSYQGTQLNAPNDLSVRGDGTIYFTDPDFISPDPPLLGFNGLYRIEPVGGTLILEAQLHSPNGVVLAPDEQTLYVANQILDQVLSFPVQPDGSLGGATVFASNTPTADGMTVDVDGNLFVATATGSTGAIHVFAPSGSSWGTIAVAEPARNCAFGSADRRTLYITAGTSVYSVRLTIPGQCPADPVNFCTAGVSAAGCQATLSTTGTASASAASGFTLSAASVEGNKDGLFFFNQNGRQANTWGSGTSYQCVVPPVYRAGLRTGSGTPGLCDGAFAQDLNALWCPGCPSPLKNPGEGAVVQAQLWYRDPMNTSNQTTSLSDAVEFCVGP
jgi:gluconolactonase